MFEKRLGKGFAHLLLQRRFLFLSLLLLLMLAATVGLRNFYPSIDPQKHTFLSEKERQMQQFYAEKFADSYPLLFYLEPQQGMDLFSSEVLAYHQRVLDAAVTQLPQVLSSFSVFSLLPQGTIFPLDSPTAQWLAARVQQSPLVSQTLVDPQRRSLIFLVMLQQQPALSKPAAVEKQPFFSIGEQVQDLRAQLADPRFKLLVSGVPVMIHQQVVELRRDLVRILIALIVVSLLMMVLVIRSLVGIMGAVVSAGGAVLLLFGGMGLLGVQIDLSFVLVPTLLTCAISIGYTVHFLNHYRRTMGRVGHRALALEIAWKRSFQPLLFTTLTTALSLLSLLQTRVPVIQVAGAASAAAVSIVFLLTIVVLPCILSFQPQHLWGAEIQRRKQVLEDSHLMNRSLMRFSRWMLSARRPVIIFSLLFTFIMSYFIFRVDITLDYARQMGPRLPFSRDRAYLQQTGYVPFDSISLLLNFPKRGAIEPTTLAQLEQLQTEVRQRFPDLVVSTSSLANVVRDFQQFFHQQQDFPLNAALVNGLLLQLRSSSKVSPFEWVSRDLGTLRVQINLDHFEAAQVLELGAWLLKRAPQLLPQLSRADMSGFIYQESSKNQLLTQRMLSSYALSLLLITLVFWLLFRKLSVTLIAMVPNLLPVLISGGLLGLFGVKLDYILMMLAPMVMGLAVDDTIHFCHYALGRYHTTGNLVKSLEVTMRHIGVSLIETSLILTLAFATFLLARTSIIANMGWLAIVGIGIALLADLTLTPVLLYQLLSFQLKRRKGVSAQPAA